jgi:hypothetical protein
MNESPSVGTELATAVALALVSGKCLAYSHPYYCGIALLYLEGGVFVYVEVGDWSFPSLEKAIELESRGQAECRVLKSTQIFID